MVANFALVQKCAMQTHRDAVCVKSLNILIENARYSIKIESVGVGESSKRGKRGSVKKDALALDHQNMHPACTLQSKRR